MEILKRTETTKLTAHDIEEWMADTLEDNIIVDEQIINKPMEDESNNDSDDAASSTNNVLVKPEDALNAMYSVIQCGEVNSFIDSRLLALRNTREHFLSKMYYSKKQTNINDK